MIGCSKPNDLVLICEIIHSNNTDDTKVNKGTAIVMHVTVRDMQLLQSENKKQ
jgi:hypothetical protein